MKTTLMTICLFAVGLLACKHETDQTIVPSVVQNTLKVTYQNAQDIEWEQKDNLYEAEFEIGVVEHAAFISPAGKLIMHKMDIQATELPEAVKNALNKEYPGQQLDDVEKIDKEGIIYYQVELEGSLLSKNLIYNAQGVKTESIPYWD